MKKATEKRLVFRFRNTHFAGNWTEEQKTFILCSAMAAFEEVA